MMLLVNILSHVMNSELLFLDKSWFQEVKRKTFIIEVND